MLPLGTLAPDFSLPAANPSLAGETVALADLMDGARGLVVVFTCNHCPFAIHVEDRLIELAHMWKAQGIATVAISSNDVEAYPQDALPHMAERAATKGYPFPYLYDETQDVAKAYDAALHTGFLTCSTRIDSSYTGAVWTIVVPCGTASRAMRPPPMT